MVERLAAGLSSRHSCEIRLLKDGRPVQIVADAARRSPIVVTEPGVYRMEAYRRFWGHTRTWIFSNPIYVTLDVRRARWRPLAGVPVCGTL